MFQGYPHTCEPLSPLQLLARFGVVADDGLDIKRVEHHVHMLRIRHSGEDLAADSKRWVAPMLLLYGFG